MPSSVHFWASPSCDLSWKIIAKKVWEAIGVDHQKSQTVTEEAHAEDNIMWMFQKNCVEQSRSSMWRHPLSIFYASDFSAFSLQGILSMWSCPLRIWHESSALWKELQGEFQGADPDCQAPPLLYIRLECAQGHTSGYILLEKTESKGRQDVSDRLHQWGGGERELPSRFSFSSMPMQFLHHFLQCSHPECSNRTL